MNTNIATVFEPVYQHLQTVMGEALARFSGLSVVMAEPRSRVIFFDPTPVNGGGKIIVQSKPSKCTV